MKNIISILILLYIQTSIARSELVDDLQYSRQTAITRAIDKVSNAVVGNKGSIGDTGGKEQIETLSIVVPLESILKILNPVGQLIPI